MLSDTYYFLLLNPICWYFQSVSPSLPSSLWSILLIRLQTNYLALFALISNNMGRWEKKLEIKGRRDVVHAIQSREMSHHVFVVVSQLTPPPPMLTYHPAGMKWLHARRGLCVPASTHRLQNHCDTPPKQSGTIEARLSPSVSCQEGTRDHKGCWDCCRAPTIYWHFRESKAGGERRSP